MKMDHTNYTDIHTVTAYHTGPNVYLRGTADGVKNIEFAGPMTMEQAIQTMNIIKNSIELKKNSDGSETTTYVGFDERMSPPYL